MIEVSCPECGTVRHARAPHCPRCVERLCASLDAAKGGFGTVPVLTNTWGLPWCPVTEAYLPALRPSSVRVIEAGQPTKTDARCWRVTVYLDARRHVRRIEQEVEVSGGTGYDVARALDALRALCSNSHAHVCTCVICGDRPDVAG